MTPGTRNITIYRGAAFHELLSFQQPDGTAVDLTGLSPFVAEIRKSSRAPLILALTVTDTDLENGKITLSATSSETDDLELDDYAWGLIDNADNLYVFGSVTVTPMIPEPV